MAVFIFGGLCGCSADEANTQSSTQEEAVAVVEEEVDAQSVEEQSIVEEDTVTVSDEIIYSERVISDYITVYAPSNWEYSESNGAYIYTGDGELQFSLEAEANQLEYAVIVEYLNASETTKWDVSGESMSIDGYDGSYFSGVILADDGSSYPVCMCIALLGDEMLTVSYGKTDEELSAADIEFFADIIGMIIVGR